MALVLMPVRLIFGSHGICLPFSSMRGMFGCGVGSMVPGCDGSIGPLQSPDDIATGCELVVRKRLKRGGRSLHVLQPIMNIAPDKTKNRAR